MAIFVEVVVEGGVHGGELLEGLQVPDSAAGYDLAPWRGENAIRQPNVATAFAQISPERELFAFNTVDNLRNDYLQLIMGSGQGPWTTAKIAEVFSRLTTATKVTPRFIRPTVADTPPDVLVFTPTIIDGQPNAATPARRPRDNLLAQMALVTEPGCTGGKLNPAIVKLQRKLSGYMLRVFAKTGTPTDERARLSPVEEATNNLLGAGLLQIRNDQIVTTSGSATDDALHQSLADRDVAKELEESNVSMQAAERYIVAFNHLPLVKRRDQLPDGRHEPWLNPSASERFLVHGSVMALTLAVYPLHSVGFQTPPLAGITIVVNMEGRKDGPQGQLGDNATIPVIGALLDGVVGDELVATLKQKDSSHAASPFQH